jgi:hypothetical protein
MLHLMTSGYVEHPGVQVGNINRQIILVDLMLWMGICA